MPRVSIIVAPLALLAAVGCSEMPVGSDADAAVDATPMAPEPPAPVAMVCPEGWDTLTEPDGSVICEPWPEGARTTCDPGELLVPGTGCEAIVECDDDTMPVLEDGAVLVRAGSPAGGDGTPAAPFATIHEAIDATERLIALAPGTHVVDRQISNVTIYGACPRNTTVHVTAPVPLSRTTLRSVHVTIAAGARLGVARGIVGFDRVWVSGDEGLIQLLTNGELHAQRVVLEVGSDGNAIYADDGGAITLETATFRGPGTALAVIFEAPEHEPGTVDVTLRDVVVTSGDGIHVRGASFLAEQVVIEDARYALSVLAPATTIRDLVVRRARDLYAVNVADAHGAVLDRIRIEDVRQRALGLVSADGTASDVFVRNAGSAGIVLEDAAFSLSRARVREAAGAGIAVGGAAGRLTASHVDISDIAGAASIAGSGGGVMTERGATTIIDRVRVLDVLSYGLGVDHAWLEASDVSISGVRVQHGQPSASGVGTESATLVLSRADIRDVAENGLFVGSSSATVSDVTITDVITELGTHGTGVVVHAETAAATLTAERVSIERVTQWGLIVWAPGSSAVVDHLTVRDVAQAPCGDTCADTSGGAAIVAYDRATLTVRDFLAEGSTYAGAIAVLNVVARLERGAMHGWDWGLVSDNSTPRNSNRTPGIELVAVDLAGNDTTFGNRDVTIAGPMIGPIGFE